MTTVTPTLVAGNQLTATGPQTSFYWNPQTTTANTLPLGGFTNSVVNGGADILGANGTTTLLVGAVGNGIPGQDPAYWVMSPGASTFSLIVIPPVPGAPALGKLAGVNSLGMMVGEQSGISGSTGISLQLGDAVSQLTCPSSGAGGCGATNQSTNASAIIGTTFLPNGIGQNVLFPVFWANKAAQPITLSALPGYSLGCTATSITSSGAYGWCDGSITRDPVFWDAANAYLPELVSNLVPFTGNPTAVEAATNFTIDDTLVGYGTDPNGRTNGWVAIVPEPRTSLLMMVGVLGLAITRRVST